MGQEEDRSPPRRGENNRGAAGGIRSLSAPSRAVEVWKLLWQSPTQRRGEEEVRDRKAPRRRREPVRLLSPGYKGQLDLWGRQFCDKWGTRWNYSGLSPHPPPAAEVEAV